MSTIKVPASKDAVINELEQLGKLLRAKEWERAALLASVVRLPGRGGPPDRSGQKRESGYVLAAEFAAYGIIGLRDPDTVRRYVQRWLDANDGEYPKLGKAVKLPDFDWPPTSLEDSRYDIVDKEAIAAQALADGTGASKAVDIAKNVKAMAAAIKASPAVAQAAAAALPPAAAERVYERVVEQRIAAVDRGPGGRTIPQIVDQQSRQRDAGWYKTRETKMRNVLVTIRDGLEEMRGYVAEGDLSTEELALAEAVRVAIDHYITWQMELLL